MKEYKELVSGEADWNGNSALLEVVNIKSSDYPATIYFDTNGNQVVSSKRFSPMSVNNPLRLRAGSYYKVETQLEISTPIPDGVAARVVPEEGISESGLVIVADAMQPGFTGPVSFNVFCGRRVAMDLGVRIARIEFYRTDGGAASKSSGGSTSGSKGGSKSGGKKGGSS